MYVAMRRYTVTRPEAPVGLEGLARQLRFAPLAGVRAHAATPRTGGRGGGGSGARSGFR